MRRARAFFPRQPIWRVYILSRVAAKYSGLLNLFAAARSAARAVARRG